VSPHVRSVLLSWCDLHAVGTDGSSVRFQLGPTPVQLYGFRNERRIAISDVVGFSGENVNTVAPSNGC
jgi:hypothetical protein